MLSNGIIRTSADSPTRRVVPEAACSRAHETGGSRRAGPLADRASGPTPDSRAGGSSARSAAAPPRHRSRRGRPDPHPRWLTPSGEGSPAPLAGQAALRFRPPRYRHHEVNASSSSDGGRCTALPRSLVPRCRHRLPSTRTQTIVRSTPRASDQRKRRDSNPRTLAGLSLSRRVHSAALPRFPAGEGTARIAASRPSGHAQRRAVRGRGRAR